ncbi:MAG: MlaD family protein [Candidatus Melainabacteria bacterium]|nr:MlaD family protein [Candidatus Melainabacteria bacterium]
MTATVKDPRDITVQEDRAPSSDGALGVFATVALLLLLWGYCWLKNYQSFSFPQYINVKFHEVAGLTDNAGVFVDGVRIGIVEKIQWQEPRDVRVKLRINSDRVSVPIGSKFSIMTNGVVGARYIEIDMPKETNGLQPLNANEVVLGQDPVRPELAVNNIAMGLADIDFKELRETVSEDHDRLVHAANQVDKMVNKAYPIMDETLPLQRKASVLADDLRTITNKLSKLIDNPKFSSDLKETASQIRQTMVHVQDVMTQVNTMVADKGLRNDIYGSLEQLNKASTSMEKSMGIIQSMSDDGELRSDLKVMLKDARTTMTKVDKIVTDPEFGVDLKKTLVKARSAIAHVDDTAKQLNQILGKRAPLLHMLFGRPGKLKKQDKSSAALPDSKEALKEKAKKEEQEQQEKIESKTRERAPVPPNLAPSTQMEEPQTVSSPSADSTDDVPVIETTTPSDD